MQLRELADLYDNLSIPAQRLVVLYVRALLLKQEVRRPSIRHRLALMRKVFDPAPALLELLPLLPAPVTKEYALVIDEALGVSAAWLLRGSTDALAMRILEFCREDASADRAERARA